MMPSGDGRTRLDDQTGWWPSHTTATTVADAHLSWAYLLVVPYRTGYSRPLIPIHQTETFARWFGRLKDRRVRSQILVRIRRLSLGNAGDVAPVGEGVSEMRIHHGPGYRIYYVERKGITIVLLAGGDKRTQQSDIQQARLLARNL